MLTLIIWQIIALINSFNKKQERFFIVYQINKHSYFLIKNKTSSTINMLDSNLYAFHIKPHITALNNSKLKIQQFNYIEKNNQKILILNSKNYLPKLFISEVNTLLLANNYDINERKLERFSNLKTIISDGSNTKYYLSQLEKLCSKFGIKLIDTKKTGAYILNL